MTCFSSSGIGGIGTCDTWIPPGVLLHHDVERAELGHLVGIVLAEVAAAAFLPLDGRARDRLGHRQQVPQVDRRVPAGVILAVAFDADARLPLVERRDLHERVLHLGLEADDAHQVLHRLLEILLHLVGILALAAALERHERVLDGLLRRAIVDARLPGLARVLRRVFAGALAEDDQIRERVAAETVGAVDARRALARREQSRDVRHLRVGVHADPAHDVVRRRADFHRLLRDVEVGQLLELVIHARELPLDVLLGVRQLLLDPRDVEEHAAVRRAAARLDLAVDAARDVVAREQLRRTPGALVVLRVAPAFFGIRGGLRLVVVRDVVEHEAAALRCSSARRLRRARPR